MKRLMSILFALCVVVNVFAVPVSAATLSVPTNFKVTVSSTTVKVSLSWKAVSGASGYQINVKDKESGTSKKYNVSKTSASLSDKELTAGKSYTVAVRAYIRSNDKITYGKYTGEKAIKLAAKTAKTSTPIDTSSETSYTDGNIYIHTDDHHYIVKIDPKFKGYEIMYEGTNAELNNPPIYRNGYLFFMPSAENGKQKILRLDVKTKKLTTVFDEEKVEGFKDWIVAGYGEHQVLYLSNWTVVGNQIYIHGIKSGGDVTVWMCNLDGSNLRKVIVDVNALSMPTNEYNGKIYMVTDGGLLNSATYETATFYEMKIDGTGFKKLFTKKHSVCDYYSVSCVQNGYIYYQSNAAGLKVNTSRTIDTGVFKVKLDGSGQKRVFTDRSTDPVVTDGINLYATSLDYSETLRKVDKNGKVNSIKTKGVTPYGFTNLNNGYLFIEDEKQNILFSMSDSKIYAISDYSPSPFVPAKTENEATSSGEGLDLQFSPKKTTFIIGEKFDITGIKAYFTGRTTKGVKIDITDKLTFVFSPEGVKETDITLVPGKAIPKKLLTIGYELGYEEEKGKEGRLIEVRHGGVTVNTYWIDISDGVAEAEEAARKERNASKVGKEVEADVSLLADGDYYFQIYGKYLYPVYASGDYWIELSDQVPDYPFTVKLAYEDAERGPAYDITIDGGAAWSVYNQGDQLRFGGGGVDPTSPKWRINKYSSFCTIRDYRNQKLIVNASGQKSNNGTKVIVWPHTGSAPANAKIKVFYAK